MQHLLKHFHELSLYPKNAKELKSLIVRLALRGNLTEKWRKKNSNVRPASELIDQIQKEKRILIEKRKLKLRKINEIKVTQDMMYSIPSSWEWYKFSDVVFFQEGPGIRKWQFRDSGVKLLNVQNIVGDSLILDNTDKHVERAEFQQKYEHFKVEEGDLLFASSGGSWGKSAWFSSPGYDVMLNTSMIRMCFYSKDWFPMYLKTFVSSGFFVDQMSEQLVGIQPNFGSTHLSRIYIPIPPLEEQEEIVKTVNILFKELEALENLSEKRIKLKKNYATSALSQLAKNNSKAEWQALKPQFHTFFNEVDNIKKLRETILQLTVQGKLTAKWRAQNPDLVSGVNSAENLLKAIKAEKVKLIKEKKIKKEKALPPINEDEIPYELPEGWVWCRMGELIHLKSGQDLKPHEYSDTDVIGLPYVTGASNLKNEKVIISRWTNVPRSIAFRGDLLITCKGSGVGKMGWLNEESAHIARQIMAINTFCSPLKYIKVLMDVNAMIYRKNAIGLIPGIDRKTVLETLVGCPPIEEQKAIVQKVNSLMALCDQLEREVEISHTQIEDLMQSVLKEFFEDNTVEELENA